MNRTNNYINTLPTASHSRGATLFVYHSGIIDPQSITMLLAQVENCLYSVNSPAEIKIKIVEIMIELLQNIYHHIPSTVDESKKESSTFLFEKKENSFMLTTTNMIHKNDIDSLNKRISGFNLCTQEQLKNLYRDILKNGKLSNNNAGLGWIDIRRKSGNPISFKFIPEDNNYSLFTVSVLV